MSLRWWLRRRRKTSPYIRPPLLDPFPAIGAAQGPPRTTAGSCSSVAEFQRKSGAHVPAQPQLPASTRWPVQRRAAALSAQARTAMPQPYRLNPVGSIVWKKFYSTEHERCGWSIMLLSRHLATSKRGAHRACAGGSSFRLLSNEHLPALPGRTGTPPRRPRSARSSGTTASTSPSPFQDRGGREGGMLTASSRYTITQRIPINDMYRGGVLTIGIAEEDRPRRWRVLTAVVRTAGLFPLSLGRAAIWPCRKGST